MSERCVNETEIAKVHVRCEREHGHGGSHTARIDDIEIDSDFTYVVSWWPTLAADAAAQAVPRQPE